MDKTDCVIQTYNEVIFSPFDPKPEMVNIVDIAHATAMNCRFNGHVHEFYSVAQHCVLAANIILEETNDPTLALWGLLHDASEAYIADLASPIKKGIPGYKETEAHIQAAVMSKYGLTPKTPEIVNVVDLRLLVTEARDLMPGSWLVRHGHKYKAEPYQTFRISGWDWRVAEAAYINTFEDLMLRRLNVNKS